MRFGLGLYFLAQGSIASILIGTGTVHPFSLSIPDTLPGMMIRVADNIIGS